MSFCYCLRASAASHARLESSSYRPSNTEGGTSNGAFVKSLDQSVPVGQITHSMEEKKKAQKVARQHAITLQVGVSTKVEHAIDVEDEEDMYRPTSLPGRITPSFFLPDNPPIEVQLPARAAVVCAPLHRGHDHSADARGCLQRSDHGQRHVEKYFDSEAESV